MRNVDFYGILDEELSEIVDEKISEDIKEKLKQDQQKKSYAFMIWFLNFYSGIQNVEHFVTDGHGDHSCDIILDRFNSQGEKTFYLIQSKWNVSSKCNEEFDSGDLKSYLSDVHSLIRGDKDETQNEGFNSRYRDLLDHVKANGEVKVIYLCLKNNCSDCDENIESLERALGGRISVEGFDINRLKMDYINKRYKRSSPPNPLEKIYSPEYERISISVARDDDSNHLIVDRPFEAHVFNIKPSQIYSLVERYGVSLFDKNVRNPLMASAINSEIKSTLLNNPSYFWYYNNGITAIAQAIPPIGSQAETFEVIGLQVINGAQTAYSIYSAYLEASAEQREIIDSEARITLRLLKSGGKDFDLKVTRYTNSQNPVSDRDFWSNDDIQEKIQKYFYETNVWYERRSGEFRKTPKGVVMVPNTFIANAYLSFCLCDPVSVFQASVQRENGGVDLVFTSHKDNKDGLYEKVFNKDTDPEKVYASFCAFDILTNGKGFDLESVFFSNGFHILAISRIVVEKYLFKKFGLKNVDSYISKAFQKNEMDFFKKCLMYSSTIMKKEIESAKDEDEERDNVINLMTKPSHFDLLIEKVQKMDFEISEIECLEIVEASDFEELDEQEIEDIEEATIH